MFEIVVSGLKSAVSVALAVAVAAPLWAAPEDSSKDNKAAWFKSLTQDRMADKGLQTEKLASRVSPLPKERPIEFSRAWLDKQPEAQGGDEWRCLAEALYFEARGETVKGQFAVAEVILNRIESERFPTSACGVIHQGTGKKFQCQFTYTCDGHKEVIREPKAFERVGKVARIALDRRAPELTRGATHYHTRSVNPSWARVYTKTATIGHHIFYRHTWQTASN